jgi:hypothetical protein
MKQSKQPFTIEGSVPLKKALLEETGIELYSEKSLNDTYLTPCHYSQHLCSIGVKESIHYQLPQQWDEAVEAVKGFFTKEKFEKGKWYYGKWHETEWLYRYNHMENQGAFNKFFYTERVSGGIYIYFKKTDYIANANIINCLQPATKEQIQEMLGKVAESKGFVKGVKVRSLFANNIDVIDGNFYLELATDSLWSNGDNNLIKIYENGKWAELLPQEEPKPETPETLVLKDVKIGGTIWPDIELTADHLEQLSAYFNK